MFVELGFISTNIAFSDDTSIHLLKGVIFCLSIVLKFT